MIQAYFIGIGNELLQGKIQDRNLHWLGRFLFQNNIHLKKSSFVRDDANELIHELEIAFEQADLIIASGGLGPTADDMTKVIVAQWLDLEIKECPKAKEIVLKQFSEKNRPYDLTKFDYHKIPYGFEALYNRIGYAPGLYYQKNGKKIFFLPGVPSEFQSILKDSLLPNIISQKLIQKNIIFKIWNIPESQIFQEREPQLWSQLSPYGTVSSLPHVSGVDIGVTVKANDLNELQIIEKKIKQIMYESSIAESIWHEGELLIENVVHNLLIEKKMTLSTAESCTGGLVADMLTNISGSSAHFIGGAVTYASQSKVKILGVNADTIEKNNVVSENVAKEMVIQVKKLYGTDYALSTTGVAGPTGGTELVPVGTVCIGIATPENVTTKTFHLKGDRRTLKIRFAEFALQLLREELIRGSI